jgi:uncharacterized protein YecT (DUF1311 family)
MKIDSLTRNLIFMLLGAWALAMPAQAIGLNCAKANSKAELLICDERNNPDLYSLDSGLNTFYGELLGQIDDEKSSSLIREQRAWLKTVRDACGDAECLRRVYQARVSELQERATLCSAREVVVFSCVLPGKKVVSLCSSRGAGSFAGYMQYRMGQSRHDLEMQYPKEESLAKKHFKYLGSDYDNMRAVSFWSDENRFTVFYLQTRYADDDAAGVIVSRGRPPVRGSRVRFEMPSKACGLPFGSGIFIHQFL